VLSFTLVAFLFRAQNLSADSMDLEASRDIMGLQGFLDLERARPNVTNAQHIQNKLIYDAVNEVTPLPPQRSIASLPIVFSLNVLLIQEYGCPASRFLKCTKVPLGID
jgi:hypothetical protein